MANKSFRLADDVCTKLDEISARENNISQAKIVERLIIEYYSRGDGEVGADCQKKNDDSANADTSSNAEIQKLLGIIKYIVNENNKKLFILQEVINSLIMTTFKCFPERFKSTTIEGETHDWFFHADDMLQKILNEKMANKKIRGE